MDRNEELRLLKKELARRKFQRNDSIPENYDRSSISMGKEEELSILYAERERKKAAAQAKEELSTIDKAAQVVRGLPAGAGSLIDLAQLPVDFVKEKVTGKKVEKQPYSEKFAEGFDKLYGKDLTPTDDAGRFRQGIGEFLTPLPGASTVKAAKVGAGILTKMGAKEASKIAAKNLIGPGSKGLAAATGASALVNLTPRISEPGTLGGMAEDVLKAGVGAGAGKGALSLGKGVVNTALHPIKTAEKGLAKATSYLMTPKEEIINKAKKHNVEMPLHVGSDSHVLDFVENNYTKSMFSSRKYNKHIEQADKSLLGAVNKELDTLGTHNVNPEVAASALTEHAKKQEEALRKQASALYAEADRSLTEFDFVNPRHTKSALGSKEMKKLLNADAPSPDEKKVISQIKDVMKAINKSSVPPDIAKQYSHDPKMLEVLEKKFGKNKGIHLDNLIGMKTSLLKTLNYESHVRGTEAVLKKLIHTLDTDIKLSKNREFVGKYKEANKFFRENIGETFREDVGASVIRNRAQKNPYLYMNSVRNIKKLERVVGNSPEGKKVLDDLKKAKMREILEPAINGDLKGEGSLRTGTFANIFQKGEKKQDLIEALIGKKSFDNLSEIAEISREWDRSGKRLLNTSSTSHVSSDLKASKQIGIEAFKAIGFIFGAPGAAAYQFGPTSAAIAAAANPYVVSLLLSNKDFITQARIYALARQKGNDKFADGVFKTMMRMSTKAIANSRSVKAVATSKSDSRKKDLHKRGSAVSNPGLNVTWVDK